MKMNVLTNSILTKMSVRVWVHSDVEQKQIVKPQKLPMEQNYCSLLSSISELVHSTAMLESELHQLLCPITCNKNNTLQLHSTWENMMLELRSAVQR